MMRSLWSGVAGLKTHQMEMDVIGNNIANVNTTAYKSQATGFQDILYQTVKDASGAGNNRATTNASQVGLGSKVASIYTNITAQGSAITTNNVFDLMITGPSFFIISPDASTTEMNYTRDGSLTVDANGDLVTQGSGYYVYGQMGDKEIPTTGTVVLQTLKVIDRNRDMDGDGIKESDYIEGTATSESYLKGNLDREDTSLEEGRNVFLEVFGNDGEKYTIKFKFTDNADTDDSTYKVEIDKITDAEGNTVASEGFPELTFYYDKHNGRLESISPKAEYSWDGTSVVDEDGTVTATNVTLSGDVGNFDRSYTVTGKDGQKYTLEFQMRSEYTEDSDYAFELTRIKDANGNVIKEYDTEETPRNFVGLDFSEKDGSLITVGGEKTTSYTFDFGEELPIGPISFDFGEMEKLIYGSNNFVYNFDGAASVVGPLNVDFSNVTNYAGKFGSHASTLNAYQGDTQGLNKGYANGVLTGISFTDNGSIYGTYSNGQTIKKGQIVVAEFSNAMGLEKVGDNLYKASLNSGDPMVMDITRDGGYITSGVLEGSNVDLAKEFTDMITTQRGFQANSKVITTSDEMLQLLKGLKR